jgi:hypothetical protein
MSTSSFEARGIPCLIGGRRLKAVVHSRLLLHHRIYLSQARLSDGANFLTNRKRAAARWDKLDGPPTIYTCSPGGRPLTNWPHGLTSFSFFRLGRPDAPRLARNLPPLLSSHSPGFILVHKPATAHIGTSAVIHTKKRIYPISSRCTI